MSYLLTEGCAGLAPYHVVPKYDLGHHFGGVCSQCRHFSLHVEPFERVLVSAKDSTAYAQLQKLFDDN
jgi:hypothetical protein